MNAYPPPPPSLDSHQQRIIAPPGPPPSAPTTQPHLQQSYPQQPVQNAPTPMRPPPLDTSFIYNGSSTHHVQYLYQYQQQQQQQYEYNNNSTVYPNTPSLTSRPQSAYYQTPPSSNGSNNNNNSSMHDSNIRSRRISVTTGDNGWKVGGAGGKRSSIRQQPRAAVVDGADFHERRMQRQSTGATIYEPPITPAYTPKTPGNNCRDSYNGYFSQTHATMSPQELAAPTMHPQPITKRESFVGGFILPPAYPPYGSQQSIQQPQQQQRPQTPHTPHYSQQYPTQTSYATYAQQQYPQTPHTPHYSQQYPTQTSHATHAQQQYSQTPHTTHHSQQYPAQTSHATHAQQQYSQTPHTTQHSQHRMPQQQSYHQNMNHQQYQQQPTTSSGAQQYADDFNSYNRSNNNPQQQHHRNRSTSASSNYFNDSYYNNPTSDEITFSHTTGAEYSAISEDPPTERARSVKSVRSVKSSKSLKSAGGSFAAGESRQLPAKKRQIIVQSINVGHRVHIDVAANETGQSLAEKVHQIATFRTRKIISITTAAGRKIPLDRRPVFDGWADIQNFQNEEEWDVEWTSLDKSMMDRFLSKVVQVGEGGSTSNEVRVTNNNNAKNEMQQ